MKAINLPEDIKKAIKMIIAVMPNVVFGGSIALNCVGLIDRPISDIDLFVPATDSLNHNGFLSIESDIELSDTVTDMNGNEIQRTGAKINGVKVCVFKVYIQELQCSKFDLFGMPINIQNVNYAIMAKRIYANKPGKWNEKHINDLRTIDNILDLI